VFVTGEAGVGKTSLLRRFCAEQHDAPRLVWGACDPLFTPRPLGPLVDVAEATGGELLHVVDEGAKPQAVAAALIRELAVRGPTVLVLEDLQWADEATLDVIALLGRKIETVPALAVLTYRDDELDRRHPLRIVLGGFARARALRRVDLTPLSRDALARLAEPRGIDADELYRRTGGNPFFATEVLAAGDAEVPATVREAVLARAASLSPQAEALLEAVAVAPPHVPLWLLEALTEDDLDGDRLPKKLQPHRRKLFGLTIDPVRLQQIRTERKPGSRYATLEQCKKEVALAEEMFRIERLPALSTTHTSIEEIASKVLAQFGIQKHMF